uniref:Uncharacterized protein n=1 Tax=Burkholderia phage vB_BgluM-SURPRISE13 TaxID=3159457 RepID=A0AAU7PFB5_9VIRU
MLSRPELEEQIRARREQNLKDLMEDRGPGIERLKRRAEMTLSIYKRNIGPISYDECIKLVNENDQLSQDCGPFDPAYDFLTSQRNTFLRLAEALNDHDNMGRRDHMLPAKVLVSVDNIAVECDLWIPRLFYRASDRESIIRSTIHGKLSQSSEWAGSLRHGPKVDFVEL